MDRIQRNGKWTRKTKRDQAVALKRFMYLERKMEREPDFKRAYVEMIRELRNLGYIRLATERPQNGEMVYYIPHHCVSKKPRIVYDASCCTDKGISLNDTLMLGPKLQRDLDEIIMRFRRHPIALCADIKKMFNQVKVNPEHWNLLRIFWRENPNAPLREYYLTVVPFGLTASGHLSVRSMIQAAKEAER